ncbi:MAG: hypothetical protein ABL999_20165 [Pyrinomonadaceae bacterium]
MADHRPTRELTLDLSTAQVFTFSLTPEISRAAARYQQGTQIDFKRPADGDVSGIRHDCKENDEGGDRLRKDEARGLAGSCVSAPGFSIPRQRADDWR